MGVSDRTAVLRSWLSDVLGPESLELTPASSDASFRRYWRVRRAGETWIAMDAPPEFEDCGRYADLARRFRACGLNTPEIHAEFREQGFLLISDLGDRVYLGELNEQSADRLYGDALDALETLQTRAPVDGLPQYDTALLTRELGLFREWLLQGLLERPLDARDCERLDRVESVLIASALEQPRVCVHRDYHSRNLMLTEAGNPGVLDFQDAVVGPITYDLVSLLRDCYIAWPEARVRDWALGYFQRACASGLLNAVEAERFERWFDLMGMQRHLKASGIFARLSLRDGKHGYLADIPRTLGYVLDVAGRYPELREFGDWLGGPVSAALESRLAMAA
ncbi:aminoglycoside phosphotransferase family protein [Allochromatium vinosum]|uniref:aminoglycoside phosphotransferase family protein n=1 Tax=Allochromatium vinosum TaxID=1049 RepID=UPI001A93694B|nr:phosphotransferase [Allochromatium vinosum]